MAATWERIVGGVLVGVAAVMVALIECFYVDLHGPGGVPVPVSQAVAFGGNLVFPWLMFRATEVRGTALLPAFGWIVVAFIFAASGPAGDVVVPGNWQGISFLLVGALAAVGGVALVLPPGRRGR